MTIKWVISYYNCVYNFAVHPIYDLKHTIMCMLHTIALLVLFLWKTLANKSDNPTILFNIGDCVLSFSWLAGIEVSQIWYSQRTSFQFCSYCFPFQFHWFLNFFSFFFLILTQGYFFYCLSEGGGGEWERQTDRQTHWYERDTLTDCLPNLPQLGPGMGPATEVHVFGWNQSQTLQSKGSRTNHWTKMARAKLFLIPYFCLL